MREKKRRRQQQPELPAYKPSLSPEVEPAVVETVVLQPQSALPLPQVQQLTPEEQEQFEIWKRTREGTVAVNEPEIQQWKDRRIEGLSAQVQQLASQLQMSQVQLYQLQQQSSADIIMPMHVKSGCPNCDEVHAATYELTINGGQVKSVKHVKQKCIKRGRSVRMAYVEDEDEQ